MNITLESIHTDLDWAEQLETTTIRQRQKLLCEFDDEGPACCCLGIYHHTIDKVPLRELQGLGLWEYNDVEHDELLAKNTLTGRLHYATELNDDFGLTFAQIATLLRGNSVEVEIVDA